METPIIARYEDAIKFIQNDIRNSAKKALTHNALLGSSMALLAERQGQIIIEYCKLLAFIYGKTEDQVADDITKVIEDLKGQKQC